MNIGIDDLFDMLSWNSDEETQKIGIELAASIKCYSVFLQPHGMSHSKDIWENCAKILAKYPDETLEYCSRGLLEWLQDMNWPGSEIVLKRLVDFQDTRMLSLFVVRCVKEALACDDQIWLGNMSVLLDNCSIKDNLPKDVYDTLYHRYRNVW